MKTLIQILKVAVAVPLAAVAFFLLVSFAVRPWLSTWGASDGELRARLPGDELVPDPASQMTMAVDVNAPPEAVWPWLVQMGVDRAGLYTYEWFENWVFGLGVKNADRIQPEWQDLAPGDMIAFTPAEWSIGRTGPVVTELRPNATLVTCLGPPVENCPATWQFVLQPRGDGTTRLVLRGRWRRETPVLDRLPGFLLEAGYMTMERKMLLGLKARAERPPA